MLAGYLESVENIFTFWFTDCRTVTNLAALDDAEGAPEEDDDVPETDVVGVADEDVAASKSAYDMYKPRRTKKVDPLEQEMLKLLKQEEQENDEDRAFFLSLYGDWKRLKLSEAAKMRVKMNLMQVS